MTGVVVLDVTLIVLLVAYSWSGWRQGFVSAFLGLVGLVGGGVLALRLVPGALEEHAGIARGTTASVILLVGAVILLAGLGQVLMLMVARRIGEVVTLPAARAVDSALGLVAVLATSMLVLWVVAGALTSGGPSSISSLVSRSAVVEAVDELMPPSADRLVDGVTEALDREGFPRVFEGAGPEPIQSVPAGDPALLRNPDVRRALDSVVHLRAEAQQCGRAQVGTGWVVARGRVATNAHVVAGADTVAVRVRDEGPALEGRVVAFDAERDVAVLAVPGLDAPALDRGSALAAGEPAVVAGFPLDDGLWVGGARVRAVLDARGADIYGQPGVSRQVYSLRAQVRRGVSGGPVLDSRGRMVGMVFATSRDDSDTGYALTAEEMGPVLRDGVVASSEVSTGLCAVG
ncbi:MAG: MarP family serine protease [Ornithinibacter sp.]